MLVIGVSLLRCNSTGREAYKSRRALGFTWTSVELGRQRQDSRFSDWFKMPWSCRGISCTPARRPSIVASSCGWHRAISYTCENHTWLQEHGYGRWDRQSRHSLGWRKRGWRKEDDQNFDEAGFVGDP